MISVSTKSWRPKRRTPVDEEGCSMSDSSTILGRRFPLDIRTARDSDTGAVVHRFVHRRPSQEQLFYYCSPAMSDDGRFLPCWSNVSGTWQIHAIDRQENSSVQL